ncbi:MAG TPA: hypothetical protein VNH40_14995, partial [Gaiellaceae bacterium]|nr:hypothetical protein [Gaiellaceae bacterium]
MFDGLDFVNWGAGWPPDTNGDVGPDYYIETVNTSMGIYRKDGTFVYGVTLADLWSGAGTGTPCDNTHNGDPTVVYDSLADRFIVGDLSWTNLQSGPYYECIAVSKTGDPVNGGWYLYAVRADDASHPWLNDYPKMAIWPDGLYMTANMFDCLNSTCGAASYKEPRVWALNRDDLESGAPLRQVVVDTNSSTDDSLLPGNVHAAVGTPPAGRTEFVVSESETAYAFKVWRFHPDYSGSGTTFTGPTNVSQTSYSLAAGSVPTPGGGSLDSLADRLMVPAQYVNRNGTESLWVNHTVGCCGASTPTGVQWAQIDVTGGTVSTTPAQQQIYPSSSDGIDRWMGSLAVDNAGDMGLGYSFGNGSIYPDIKYAGRLVGDTSGTLPQTETSMLDGVTRNTEVLASRWGDYSLMTIDPNGCNFWYANEYYATAGLLWSTRIGSFHFSSCTPVKLSRTLDVSPASGDAGGTVDLSATLSRPSGSGTLNLEGQTVDFTLNGTDAGSAVTDTNGVATLTGVSLGSIGAGTYPTGVGASVASDMTYDTTTGSAQLKVNGGTTHPVADFDGDGKTDVAYFDPNTGIWHIRGIATITYGATGDIPVPGDYNGDGKTDVAYFDPNTGIWHIRGIA